MTTSPLLTIGAFARAVGLTPSALRHYDERGLLPPAEVDESTGYRYYTPDLAGRARLIVAMREVGVPIELMRRVVDGPAESAADVLTSVVRERAADAARAEAVLREVLVVTGREPQATARARVDGRALAAALRQVRPAAESDPASPLSGVLLDLGDVGVDVVATNRYWMALRTLECRDVSAPARVVLGLADAARLAERLDATDEVDLSVCDDSLTVGADAEAWSGRRVAYPAHRLLLEGLEQVAARVLVRTADLGAAVIGTGRAEVSLSITSAGLTVQADDAPSYDVGGASRGAELTLRMGSALLQRALASCLGPEVLVEASAADRPVLLRSPYQQGFLALVMPIRPE